MCGIIGYAGAKQAAPILLKGLETLEYRGYDSAGMAVMSDGVINIQKCRGRLAALAEKTDHGQSMQGSVGIGHTRWATHGEPSDKNSHPHFSQNEQFAVVHNGIIENYQELKERLERYGYTFQSETDTEVIAHLVEYCDCGDLIRTVSKVLQRIEGSYALGVLSTREPECLVAVRKDSPLVVCRDDEAGYIASDIPALLPYSRDMYLMEDNEIVALTPGKINFYNIDARPIEKEIYHVDWDVSAAEKGGYEHFMLKEIYEQPQALQSTIQSRIRGDRIQFDGIDYTSSWVEQLTGVHIIACGSAYHAGLVGRYMIETTLQRPVNVEIASEFRYRNPIVDERQLVIAVSQSGETADTLAALREAKRRGARTLAIVNVVGSSLAREAHDVIYTWAGPEISVATTKGYTTQLLALELVAVYLGQQSGRLSQSAADALIEAICAVPELAQSALVDIAPIQQMAARHFNAKDVFYIGRGIDYASSQEAYLKLKEISYIHSEGIAAGELKHGTISLIEDGSLVIGLLTQPKLREKVISNLAEVKTRGATVIAVTSMEDAKLNALADEVILIPETNPLLIPVLSVIPLQLFAYYISVYNGRDVDKPRNLAKSVTVE